MLRGRRTSRWIQQRCELAGRLKRVGACDWVVGTAALRLSQQPLAQAPLCRSPPYGSKHRPPHAVQDWLRSQASGEGVECQVTHQEPTSPPRRAPRATPPVDRAASLHSSGPRGGVDEPSGKQATLLRPDASDTKHATTAPHYHLQASALPAVQPSRCLRGPEDSDSPATATASPDKIAAAQLARWATPAAAPIAEPSGGCVSLEHATAWPKGSAAQGGFWSPPQAAYSTPRASRGTLRHVLATASTRHGRSQRGGGGYAEPGSPMCLPHHFSSPDGALASRTTACGTLDGVGADATRNIAAMRSSRPPSHPGAFLTERSPCGSLRSALAAASQPCALGTRKPNRGPASTFVGRQTLLGAAAAHAGVPSPESGLCAWGRPQHGTAQRTLVNNGAGTQGTPLRSVLQSARHSAAAGEV